MLRFTGGTQMTNFRFTLSACLLLTWFPVQIHGALASSNRIAPPPGIAIAATDRTNLEEGVSKLDAQIAQLRSNLRGNVQLETLLPDVEIFHKAVHWALSYDEFYRSNEVSIARALLKQGMERAKQLQAGQAPWLNATGLVVRGYVSKIDGSVQPYGLVVPASFAAKPHQPYRLDVWLHGRDNQLTELKFISDRLRSYGDFTPAQTFVLHPYGRYCNAFKFAGEVDVFEALEHVRKSYPIDGRRLGVRGFSMGGAGCWHLAAHHAGVWAAAAPGAGFAETSEYIKALAKDPKPSWFEQKLWHLYDATDYAVNLFNCPTIAYSGELDKQKQAADMMSLAMKAESLELVHLIGPGVEHKYEPKTKQELASRFDLLMEAGRNDLMRPVRFTTWTLRYNQMQWIRLDAMERHWERARIDADLTPAGFKVTTTNVAALTLMLPEIRGPLAKEIPAVVDGRSFLLKRPGGEAWLAHFKKKGSRWQMGSNEPIEALYKRHGLQGPIDDAFMDGFLLVRPSGRPMVQQVGDWVQEELTHATNEWRAQFRGEAPVKDDISVTDADIESNNLVLWGDPQSNRLLGQIVRKLPLRWDSRVVRVGRTDFPAARYVPVLIYPNPLNPRRYVVVNSGFTFCEFGRASNAQQTPRLPDFAVIDITVPHASRPAEGIPHAGFFGERWEMTGK